MEELKCEMQDLEIDNHGSIVVDVQNLLQSIERGSSSPKLTKALSRKGSCRMERRNAEDVNVDDGSKKVTAKVVCSPFDVANHIAVPMKSFAGQTTVLLNETGEGKCNRRFSRIPSFHPRKILLLFATMSIVGTMILICCTLMINIRRDGI